jgi:hypothetical protein
MMAMNIAAVVALGVISLSLIVALHFMMRAYGLIATRFAEVAERAYIYERASSSGEAVQTKIELDALQSEEDAEDALYSEEEQDLISTFVDEDGKPLAEVMFDSR